MSRIFAGSGKIVLMARRMVLAALLFGAAMAAAQEVSGVALDPSQAAVPGAAVTLVPSGGPPRSLTTAIDGAFRFEAVAAGSYEIRVEKEGFRPYSTRVSVGQRSPSPRRIVLAIAELREQITIPNQTPGSSVDPADNLDVIRLDRRALDELPVMDQDVVAAVARFLDPSAVGTGGVSIVVDGLETSERGVARTAIQEVRINQNPYSAENSRPGHGRIEIITTPGSPDYHGAFNFMLRDHHLEARNAFAAARPVDQRRVFVGHLTGPLGRSKKTSFLLSGEREEGDGEGIVYARSPAGDVRRNFPNRQRDTELTFRVNRQLGSSNTFSLRYEFIDESARGRGVGGFALPEVASDFTDREHHVYYNHRAVITPRLVNELYFRGGRHNAVVLSRQPGVRKIVVLDAFAGGGAQADRRDTENHVQFSDTLAWSRGRHFIKTGINVPDISRRGSNDRANYDGIFSFSSLADYAAGRPFSFLVQQGESHLAFWQKDIGVFAQDDVRLRPNLSLAFGLRWDWQNYLSDHNNFSPRLSIAYSPGKDRKTVFRGGAGYFYDRTGPGPVGETLRFDGRRQRQIALSNPGYPDPFAAAGAAATERASIVRFVPDLRSPYTVQYSFGVERQLAKSTTATLNFRSARGIKSFRSRDANAPRAPLYLRPNPSIGILRHIESSADRTNKAMEAAVRGNITRFFNGQIQYLQLRAHNNTDGINYFPVDNYDLSGEWARSEYEGRHHFNLLGTIKPGKRFQLGVSLWMGSGRPYSLTTGRDQNRDTFATDRPPGVRRNSLQGPGSAVLELRWSKEFFLRPALKEKGPTATLGWSAFNVLNRVNYTGLVGNLSSPFFGQPVASRPARRMQFSWALKF